MFLKNSDWSSDASEHKHRMRMASAHSDVGPRAWRRWVPPGSIGDPRVGDSTIPNERRHRWNGTVDSPSYLAASAHVSGGPNYESDVIGVRLAMILEPSTSLLVIGGLLGFAGWRRARA
jgi:hypothetical protein